VERNSNESVSNGMRGLMSETLANMTTGMDEYGYVMEQPYSVDEMAVLADSFFSQRNDSLGNMNEWWGTGTL